MKIKSHFLYTLGFLSILFLAQELHDWAHYIVAGVSCGCWGKKGFDNWTICDRCAVSPNMGAIIFFAGPFVTYIIIWSAWWLMDRDHTSRQRSVGFALLFAAVPFVRILAAFAGGGDETRCLRGVFQQTDGSNRHLIALAGLSIVLLLTIPPILRAFFLLSGWKERIFLFLIFLVLPLYVHQWILKGVMGKLLERGFLGTEILPGIPVLVIVWTCSWAVILTITFKKLTGLLRNQNEAMKST